MRKIIAKFEERGVLDGDAWISLVRLQGRGGDLFLWRWCEGEEMGSNNIVKMAAFQSVWLGPKLENCSQIDFSQSKSWIQNGDQGQYETKTWKHKYLFYIWLKPQKSSERSNSRLCALFYGLNMIKSKSTQFTVNCIFSTRARKSLRTVGRRQVRARDPSSPEPLKISIFLIFLYSLAPTRALNKMVPYFTCTWQL